MKDTHDTATIDALARGKGRPKIYSSAADRQRAYRERIWKKNSHLREQNRYKENLSRENQSLLKEIESLKAEIEEMKRNKEMKAKYCINEANPAMRIKYTMQWQEIGKKSWHSTTEYADRNEAIRSLKIAKTLKSDIGKMNRRILAHYREIIK